MNKYKGVFTLCTNYQHEHLLDNPSLNKYLIFTCSLNIFFYVQKQTSIVPQFRFLVDCKNSRGLNSPKFNYLSLVLPTRKKLSKASERMRIQNNRFTEICKEPPSLYSVIN